MKNAITENIESAQRNKEILQGLLEINCCQMGIYQNEQELREGIRFYDGLAKRKEHNQK